MRQVSRRLLIGLAIVFATPAVSGARDNSPPGPGESDDGRCKYCDCKTNFMPGGVIINNCGCASGLPLVRTGYRKCSRVVEGLTTYCEFSDLGKCTPINGSDPGVIG